MAAVRSKDTKPELLVRRTVHALGYRFRLYLKNLTGTPDLVFPARRKVIFVHGCFWHQHGCRRSSQTPKANEAFWRCKLERNRIRDIENKRKLNELGWGVMVIWECELNDLHSVSEQITQFLGQHRSTHLYDTTER